MRKFTDDDLAGHDAEVREQALAPIRAALAEHPTCDVHPDGDYPSCGWKRAVADISRALDEVRTLDEVRKAILLELVEDVRAELPHSPSKAQTSRMKYLIGYLSASVGLRPEEFKRSTGADSTSANPPLVEADETFGDPDPECEDCGGTVNITVRPAPGGGRRVLCENCGA